MTAVDDAHRRRQMVAQITAHAAACARSLGKSALDPRVLDVMARLPRHHFVPPGAEAQAYDDRPLAIGCGKTISQPFIVALMTDLLELGPADRVLEIGTGYGYQTAVLASLAARVFSIERQPALAAQARRNLDALGLTGVELRTGDGLLGWPEQAPFDRIIATGAPATVPPALIEQLRPGGRMVLPVGPAGGVQQLRRLIKDAGGHLVSQDVLAVRFSELEPGELGEPKADAGQY